MKIRELMLSVAIAAAVLPTGAAAAMQESTNGTCGPVPTQSECQIATLNFPGGRLSVDVDIVRSWPFGNYRTTWVCENVHAGGVSLTVDKQTPDFAHLGMRW
ncbi:hypothetical protein C8D88_113136 [Lentzea atacamensis]|uniref:Uncharacterized protein n=1 Tax=Lentzea atacamensis TaxID=531938 RepID=A0A316HRH0_9PSEU|nr:hypothetical protein [Lentzea atacamensis]PWK82543.1 hypothetical protein C8D88_113136 [Lentzea atacamensis]